jgi:hypothetical protein
MLTLLLFIAQLTISRKFMSRKSGGDLHRVSRRPTRCQSEGRHPPGPIIERGAVFRDLKHDELAKSRLTGGNRCPDAVPAKAGSHVKYWIPIFIGNPGFRLSPE